MSNNSSACSLALAVVNAPGFQTLVVLEVIIAMAAVVSNSLFLTVIWRVAVFHLNLKLLLVNFNLVQFAYATGFLIKSSTTLITIWMGDVCTFGMRSYDCKVSELVVAIPNSGAIYSSLAVCLERVYCTLRYKRYDRRGLIKPWVSIALLLISYTVTLGHQLGLLSNIARDRRTAFCESMFSMTPKAAVSSASLMLTTETVSISLSLAICLYNKRQLRYAAANRSQEDLASRYQLDQNVKVNRLLMPAMALEGFCYIPTYAFLILLSAGFQTTIESKIFLVHITYNFKLLFAFVQPILGLALNPQMKRALKATFPKATSWFALGASKVSPIVGLEQVNRAAAAIEHFDQAAKLWAMPPPAGKSG